MLEFPSGRDGCNRRGFAGPGGKAAGLRGKAAGLRGKPDGLRGKLDELRLGNGPDGQRQPHQRAAVAWGMQPDRSAVIVCYLADDG